MSSATAIWQVLVGADFNATLINPPDLTSPLGARLEMPVTRAILAYWRPATLVGEAWTVTLDAPNLLGQFELVWRTNEADPPQYETFVPIQIVTADDFLVTPDWTDVDPDVVRPLIDEVAKQERTRTVDQGGNDVGTFNDDTHPTGDEVEELIDQASDDVLGELPERFDQRHYGQVKRLITLQSALLVESSFYAEDADSAKVRNMVNSYTSGMANLKSRIQSDLDQSSLAGGMEPWANRDLSGALGPRVLSPATVGPVDAGA